MYKTIRTIALVLSVVLMTIALYNKASAAAGDSCTVPTFSPAEISSEQEATIYVNVANNGTTDINYLRIRTTVSIPEPTPQPELNLSNIGETWFNNTNFIGAENDYVWQSNTDTDPITPETQREFTITTTQPPEMANQQFYIQVECSSTGDDTDVTSSETITIEVLDSNPPTDGLTQQQLTETLGQFTGIWLAIFIGICILSYFRFRMS